MVSSFSYLEECIETKTEKGVNENAFYPLINKDIESAEKRLGFCFPSELRQFYFEIGYGFLVTKHGDRKRCGFSNRIMDPGSIADLLIEGLDSGYLHPETEFRPGEMPFFEVGEMRDFLTMYPLSDKPNAIYDNIDGRLVEESFSKFIWRLYYESPTFYLDT